MHSPDSASIASQRYPNTLGSLVFRWSFGSGVRGAWGRDLSLATGVGVVIRHSAPLEHRTLCSAPLRAPRGRLWCLSPPAPVAPSRWPVKATHLFSCYSYRDNAHRPVGKLWGPGGCL